VVNACDGKTFAIAPSVEESYNAAHVGSYPWARAVDAPNNRSATTTNNTC